MTTVYDVIMNNQYTKYYIAIAIILVLKVNYCHGFLKNWQLFLVCTTQTHTQFSGVARGGMLWVLEHPHCCLNNGGAQAHKGPVLHT